MRAGSYLDTSFLFKFYLPEAESDEAMEWFDGNRDPVFLSDLSDLELIVAFNREASTVVGIRAIDNYREDWNRGLYQKLSFDVAVFAKAEMLAEAYSSRFKLRSLDILHLAIALQYEVPSFGTYDKRLATAAEALGLQVLPTRS